MRDGSHTDEHHLSEIPTGLEHGAEASAPSAVEASGGDLQELAKRHLWMHFTRMGAYADHEVPVIVRGEGCYVYDEHGKRYLDGLSALYCVNIGHGRAELGEAAARQARGARLLHELELRPSALDRARGADRRARAREPEPRVLHLRRLGGGRVGVEARQGLPRRARRADPAQADLAQARLPRHLDGRADGDRPAGAAHAVRAADAGRAPRAEHELLPLERGSRSAVGGRRDRGGDPVRGSRARSRR